MSAHPTAPPTGQLPDRRVEISSGPVNNAEIEQTFILCCDIVDSPPPDYKFV